ncbi:diaminopimelate epimerase [Flavobacterium sp. CYK-55]|uniref:diaminopimelate epimerase n=1 Tax=Flavobacterium sp. CYK-55 TaxID=2835529 RepID=UPI001BD01C74|nr:diaminopimelate epimerase [Flavobacterium sp. CYK-55]MBS7787500.1 diaminopimelate epimerase [Flavobacterium sp. CYK-55]
MKIPFNKYEGTGNDFVMIDNRSLFFPKDNHELVKHLCDRRFGIGADGLILLEPHAAANFKMVYYNSDGNLSSMCGNGGRCLTAFARQLGVIDHEAAFEAVDGMHHATLNSDGLVSLEMTDIAELKIESDYTFLNTGSPHHVLMVDDLASLDVKTQGSAIRYSDLYGQAGSNVNFVSQINDNTFRIRTYERGVEDETLSCGTGATAVAIAMHANGKTNSEQVHIWVEGGKLEVSFKKTSQGYQNVKLIGPATFVFSGAITW